MRSLPALCVFAALLLGAIPPLSDLASWLPPSLDGLPAAGKPMTMADAGLVAGAYLDKGTRSININLGKIQDLGFTRAQYKVWGKGDEVKSGDLTFGGCEVAALPCGWKGWTRGDGLVQSEAEVLLADQLYVSVSVVSAKKTDEAAAVLKMLDIESLKSKVTKN